MMYRENDPYTPDNNNQYGQQNPVSQQPPSADNPYQGNNNPQYQQPRQAQYGPYSNQQQGQQYTQNGYAQNQPNQGQPQNPNYYGNYSNQQPQEMPPNYGNSYGGQQASQPSQPNYGNNGTFNQPNQNPQPNQPYYGNYQGQPQAPVGPTPNYNNQPPYYQQPVQPVVQQSATRQSRGRGASGISGNSNPWGIVLEKDPKPVWTSLLLTWWLFCLPSILVAIRLHFIDFSIDENIITETSGILNRKTVTVDLYRVQNINANNTFFGGGQLVFKQMGGDVVTLGPIRNVEKILPKLRQITFRARQQQGVHTNEVMY